MKAFSKLIRGLHHPLSPRTVRKEDEPTEATHLLSPLHRPGQHRQVNRQSPDISLESSLKDDGLTSTGVALDDLQETDPSREGHLEPAFSMVVRELQALFSDGSLGQSLETQLRSQESLLGFRFTLPQRDAMTRMHAHLTEAQGLALNFPQTRPEQSTDQYRAQVRVWLETFEKQIEQVKAIQDAAPIVGTPADRAAFNMTYGLLHRLSRPLFILRGQLDG